MRGPRLVTNDCVTPGCGEQARTRGACGACYSGLRRLATLNVRELDRYVWKTNRLQRRAGANLKARKRGKYFEKKKKTKASRKAA